MKKKIGFKVYIKLFGFELEVENNEEIEKNENASGDETNDNVNTEDIENNSLFGKIKKVAKVGFIVICGYVIGFTGFLSDLLSVIDGLKDLF